MELFFGRVCASFKLLLRLGNGDAPYDSPRSLLKIIHDTLHIAPGQNRYPLGPGSHPKPVDNGPPIPHGDGPKSDWDSNKFYTVGDTVNYNGHVYQCMITHQSQTSWAPDVAVALWKLKS